MSRISRLKNVSTDADSGETLAQLETGVFCYLHLWGCLRKHVQMKDADIMHGIGLWDDRQGGYFAAYTQGDRRMLQVSASYVCAAGPDGPVFGQLDKVPPCDAVTMSADARMLLNAMAQGGAPETSEKAMAQIAVIAKLVLAGLPVRGKTARTTH